MAKKERDRSSEPSDGSVPVNDAWTGMLAISLLALAVASGFLAYDIFQYKGAEEVKVPSFGSHGMAKKVDGIPPPPPPPKDAIPKDVAPKDIGVKDVAPKDAVDGAKDAKKDM